MNIYDIAMMPLEAWVLKKMRSAIMSCAYGDVLEAGIGTGVNLRYYNPVKIRSLTGLDRQCSRELERRAGKFVDFANSSWTRIADGCNLNRRTDEILRQSSFSELIISERGVFRYGTAKKI